MPISAFSWVMEREKNVTSRDDDLFFAEALQQAYFCAGSTHPNPSVGAVLVRGQEIIARGFTHPVGGQHAEVHAINTAHGDVRGCSLYVTLEPCSHFGRTPPCVDAIINSGIKEVIFGAHDPNPRVNGSGLLALTNAGVVVRRIANPLLQKKADAVLAPFRKFILTHLPYVVVKVATSADFKISAGPGVQTKITASEADVVVHELRRAMDCIAVGGNTVRIDNPKLTARLGEVRHGQQPKRLVISSHLNVDDKFHIFDQTQGKTLVCASGESTDEERARWLAKGMEIIPCETKDLAILLAPMLSQLAAVGITSLLVEAGAHILQSFLAAQVVDELWWFKSAHNLGPGGLAIPAVPKLMEEQGFICAHDVAIGADQLKIFTAQPA